jgi:acetyl-CoA C-acetyltransferase
MREVVIVSAVRTPVERSPVRLRTCRQFTRCRVVKEAIRRAGIEAAQVENVVLGNVLQAGLGQNTARQVLIHSGIPQEIPAMTINKVCASGLRSVSLAAQIIKAGDADIIVAGGIENMSAAPYAIPGARWGCRMGDSNLTDIMIKDGLWDAFNQYHMGITAENVAERWKLTREELDAFALESQQRLKNAIKPEVQRLNHTVEIAGKKGTTVFDTDASPIRHHARRAFEAQTRL